MSASSIARAVTDTLCIPKTSTQTSHRGALQGSNQGFCSDDFLSNLENNAFLLGALNDPTRVVRTKIASGQTTKDAVGVRQASQL